MDKNKSECNGRRVWGTGYCRFSGTGESPIPEACMTDTSYVLMGFSHGPEGHGAARLVGNRGQELIVSTHRSRVPVVTVAVPRGPMRGDGHPALHRPAEGYAEESVALTAQQMVAIVMGGRDY